MAESTHVLRPGRSKLRYYGTIFTVLWILSACAAMLLMQGAENLGFEAAATGLALGAGWATLLTGLTSPITGRWRHVNSPEPLQLARLEGNVLRVLFPVRHEARLDKKHAAMVGLSGTQASVRIAWRAGEVALYTEVSPGTRFASSTGAATHNWPAGSREQVVGQGFGDALLRALDENRRTNLYLLELAQLEALNLPVGETSEVVELDGGLDARPSAPYRSSGRPPPGDPGFDAWLETDGMVVSDTVTVAPEYVVARCEDGIRRAFPLGLFDAARDGDERVSFTMADMCWHIRVPEFFFAEALVEWLRRRRAVRPTSTQVESPR